MQAFEYASPRELGSAVGLLADGGLEARVLAGGTDLIIRMRDGTLRPRLVVDIKRIEELEPPIEQIDGRLRLSAAATMADVADSPLVRRHFGALAEAASIVGSIQIRDRATVVGNVCNASPAADTAPPLLVYGAVVVVWGADGERTLPLEDFFVRSGVTALRPGELVTAIELPLEPAPPVAAYVRRTRRRGHDLASVTLCCGVSGEVVRLAYGSVGPRPLLIVDEGVLADPAASREARAAAFERLFADASPSPRSMRAGPAYRLAMLRVLGDRALELALARRAGGRR